MLDKADPQALLEVQHLKMHFPVRKGLFGVQSGVTKAVNDVSFSIRRGETLGLVGESGCGKSTVGRCIVRSYQPTAGRLLYHEAPDFADKLDKIRVHMRHRQAVDDQRGHVIDLMMLNREALRRYRQEIRMIFQDPYSSLNPRMTVFQIISEVLRVNKLAQGQELEDRVAMLLRRVGLRPEYLRRYPHAFSGGERQRIVIARALATNPRLIIADEAISALDVSIRAQILNLLEDLQAELDLTYLFISHDLSVVRHICDRVAVMYVGRLVEVGDAEQVFNAPKHPYTEALLSSVPISNPRQRRTRQRILLKGEVADPSNPPSGCYFHPRCHYAQAVCKTQTPELQQVRPGHAAACHFAGELPLTSAMQLDSYTEVT